MKDLRGSLAVVTGGSSGIGLETARLLVGAGADVVLVARGAERLNAAAHELMRPYTEPRNADGAGSGEPAAGDPASPVVDAGGRGGRLLVVAADVAEEAGVAEVVRALESWAARPDIVVHAAGAFALAPLAECTVEAFDRMVAVNLRAAFLLVRAFLPEMLQRGTGHIVTIGSIAGRQAWPGNGAYAASKFGVRGMHAVLAAELRGTGVRATFVEPAATDTPLWDAIETGGDSGLPARSAMLRPEAVAEAVMYAVTQPDDVAIPNILMERA